MSILNQNNNIITLDVEGVFFKTRIKTLKSIEGTWFSHFFERQDWEKDLDRDGRLFIDRDSTVFPVILNFLRDHEQCPLPVDNYHLERILREAVIFNIGPLRNIVESKLKCNCNTPVKTPVKQKPPMTKPPPPPPPFIQPPPPPSNNSSQPQVLVPMRTSKKTKATAENIGLPQDFKHLAHVGWNGASVILNKSDETVKKICDAASEAVDLNAVYNVVNKNGPEDDSESVEVLITGGLMRSKNA
ncbi:unnamed protein product [Caenorhabditis angaria]|uniref:CRIB domain-containing protein n=1 Tax=Caenorhabditis angaria TaxID=860376 RepID=A0A9P1IJ43_9PELO|nr:unnamed protein product [Caenorhabditis angaria]